MSSEDVYIVYNLLRTYIKIQNSGQNSMVTSHENAAEPLREIGMIGIEFCLSDGVFHKLIIANVSLTKEGRNMRHNLDITV